MADASKELVEKGKSQPVSIPRPKPRDRDSFPSSKQTPKPVTAEHKYNSLPSRTQRSFGNKPLDVHAPRSFKGRQHCADQFPISRTNPKARNKQGVTRKTSNEGSDISNLKGVTQTAQKAEKAGIVQASRQASIDESDAEQVVDELKKEKKQLVERLEEVEDEIRNKATEYLETIHEQTEENRALMSEIRQLKKGMPLSSKPLKGDFQISEPVANIDDVKANAEKSIKEVQDRYTRQLKKLADELIDVNDKLKTAENEIARLQMEIEDMRKLQEKINGSIPKTFQITQQLDQTLKAYFKIKTEGKPLKYGEDALEVHRVGQRRPLKFTKPISGGCYGSIYEFELNGTPCIAKRLLDILMGRGGHESVPEKAKKGCHEAFFRECVLLSRIDHPNIVHFVGVHYGQDKYDLTLILERLATDLHKFLQQPKPLPLSQKVSILCDVSSGLLYLHKHLIIHRDLTAANVLLTVDNRAKIGDLGLSKIFDIKVLIIQKLTHVPGALAYMPPEAFKDNPVYDESLDIFSYGVIALYTAVQEFPDFSWEDVPAPIVAKGEKEIYKRRSWIEKMETRQPELSPLVLWCLSDDPVNRPNTVCLNFILEEMRKDTP